MRRNAESHFRVVSRLASLLIVIAVSRFALPLAADETDAKPRVYSPGSLTIRSQPGPAVRPRVKQPPLLVEARALRGSEQDIAELTAGIDLEPFLWPPAGSAVPAAGANEPQTQRSGPPQPPFRKAVLAENGARRLLEEALRRERIDITYLPKVKTGEFGDATISLAKKSVVGYVPQPDGSIVTEERDEGLRLDLAIASLPDRNSALELKCEQALFGPLRKQWGRGPDGKPAWVKVPEQIRMARSFTNCRLAAGESLLLTGLTHKDGENEQPMAILLTVSPLE